MQGSGSSPRVFPKDVGITGIEVYFPKTCVDQTDLEKFDNAAKGKYTIGLGQDRMAFVGDREDINSLCLTACKNLMEKYNVNPREVGRLEVGTETIVDKSKATKTTLMDLFTESGNYDIEGIDVKNACYGGTAALLNAINWVESSSWDGRLAIVVAGDIAVYAAGNARPTGGCGAVAMLIGPNAPMVIERGVRGSHMDNTYDFYKPDPSVEYPTVDGQLSVVCYLKCVDGCFENYSRRFNSTYGRNFTVDDGDYFVFHAPYNKLVQKSFGRMNYNDFLQNPNRPQFKDVQKFASVKKSDSYNNVDLEKGFLEYTKKSYQEKVGPSTYLPKELGNTYTGSMYCGLVSLIALKADSLLGKRVMCFSYGSGATATLFSLQVKSCVKHIAEKINLKERLGQRRVVDPPSFTKSMDLRAQRHGTKGWTPSEPIDDLFPGTYYLEKIDDKYRRFYKRKLNIPPSKL